jgi:phosphatidylserine/phosphatidylglycerophosphate/cardiolipin synthase-like enzyme
VPDLVVSPENARERLAALIKAAKHELAIYDPKISDGPLLRLLLERAKNGVDVRVLGKVTLRGKGLQAAKLQKLRLHVRAIVRDGEEVFIGSQSLRSLELDRRREVGVIIRDRRIAKQVQAVFESDWELAKPKDKDKDSEDEQDRDKEAKKDKDDEKGEEGAATS